MTKVNDTTMFAHKIRSALIVQAEIDLLTEGLEQLFDDLAKNGDRSRDVYVDAFKSIYEKSKKDKIADVSVLSVEGILNMM